MQNVAVTGKGFSRNVPCRLFFLLAREATVGVIFRRGPSRWVQLILWNTATDELIPGQWFRGRIYERRCDLSPQGKLLVYFAQKISGKTIKDKEYTYAWTAVSRPPYFTALALWPKGDCWAGGGLFRNEGSLWLNHQPEVAKPHPKHKPNLLRVIPNPAAHGEDDPIQSERLKRDGWQLRQPFETKLHGWQDLFETLRPGIWEKESPDGASLIRLTQSIRRLDYREDFIVHRKRGITTVVDEAAWVDWDHTGRLVVAQHGKLKIGSVSKAGRVRLVELADFNASKPARVAPPDWAQRW